MDLAKKIIIQDAEIARLENIIRIQQKQVERLLAARDAEKTLRQQAQRRVRTLERCLDNADQWRFNQFCELNARGADRNDNPDYCELKKLQRILNKATPRAT